jgi:hypothetical protein
MERQDESQVNQLFGLRVQRSIGVNLLEVGGEVLVRAKVCGSLR